MKAILKFSVFIFFMIGFICVQWMASLVLSKKSFERFTIAHVSWVARLGALTLNLEVTSPRHPPIRGEFIVANHLSYLDIIVLLSLFPAKFVTSVEIKETPVLGQLTALAGCFFVERRKEKQSLKVLEQELEEIRAELARGTNVIVFPEGTSSDGSQLLPFKKTLFKVPASTTKRVTPVALKYAVTPESRDSVHWYGDMSFAPHLFKLCRLPHVKATVMVLPPVSAQDKDTLANLSSAAIQWALYG